MTEHSPSLAAAQAERDPLDAKLLAEGDGLPFRTPANVVARHNRMVELRTQGWTIDRIAEALDLWAGNTVRYHLKDRCKCRDRRDGAKAR